MEKLYSAARIRPEEHRETLARLWKENLARGDVAQDVVERRMRWFQEQNPAGPPRTWMGYHGPDREVIGSGSFYVRVVHVGGRKLKAGILGDFAVTKAHRIAGAAMSIQREIARNYREAGVDFLYAFPNKASFPIFQRAGYKKIGDATIWVRPLSADYKLHELAAASAEDRQATVSAVVQRVAERAQSAIPHARWRALWEPLPDGEPAPLPRRLSALAERLALPAIAAPDSAPVKAGSGAIKAAMELRDAATLRLKGRRVRTELIDAADDRFDALWARSTLKDNLVVGERDAAYLNWRYAQLGVPKHRFFCILDPGDGRLLGYAIYAVRNNKVEVADLFCEDFEVTLDTLMLEFCRAMRREGHDVVGVLHVGSASFGARMRALGFFARPLPRALGSRWLIAHMDPSFPEELRRILLDVNHWFMTDGELDA